MLPDTLPKLPSLDPVPLGLPAALLDRRPDLRQAEMRLEAATYGVGAAIANLYPDLSLTGSVGENGDTINDLDISNFVYNIVANLTGPHLHRRPAPGGCGCRSGPRRAGGGGLRRCGPQRPARGRGGAGAQRHIVHQLSS